MNAELPIPDLAECERFAWFWCGMTSAPHITLTAITPDGPTSTATFERGQGSELRAWIGQEQSKGRNIYFQPNETPPGCTKKPAKHEMVASLCRHADIDPDDERFPLGDERERLLKLADLLRSILTPPTVIIDSGNGLQPLWATTRELLTPEAASRVESENRAVEAALGARGTHDVSRLLRFRGTVNFPNAKKRGRGRSATRARLIHTSQAIYSSDFAKHLGQELVRVVADTGLVRARDEEPRADHTTDGTKTHHPGDDELLLRIERASVRCSTLRRRWAGDWSGLNDPSDSGKAMALGAALKRAGFSFEDMCQALHSHGDTENWAAEKGEARERYELRRIWDNTGSEQTSSSSDRWGEPKLELATRDTLPAPSLPLRDVFSPEWADWIERAARAKCSPPDYIACSVLAAAGGLIGNSRLSSPNDEWGEPPVINVANVGRPSGGKSPALDAVVDALGILEAEDNADWKERRRAHRAEKATAAEREAKWKEEVKKAVRDGSPPPDMPLDAMPPEPPQRRRVFSTDPTVAKAERMSAANARGLLLVRDELAGWIAGMDRFNGSGRGGSDRAFWIQAYGGRPWTPDRVKDEDDEISVPHLTWSVLGGIQPDRLASVLLAGDDDGLSARFIYPWPDPPSVTEPPDVSGLGVVRHWLRRLRDLPWQPPEPVRVTFSREAVEILWDWKREVAGMEDGANGLFLSWLGKLPGLAVRLALIFAYLDWCTKDSAEPPIEVDKTAILRAITFLADYAVPMARRVFGEAALPESERDARQLARWLLKQRPSPTTLNVRELRRMTGSPGIATPARIEAALEELSGLGWVRPALASRTGLGGRSRNDWEVNPALHGGQV